MLYALLLTSVDNKVVLLYRKANHLKIPATACPRTPADAAISSYKKFYTHIQAFMPHCPGCSSRAALRCIAPSWVYISSPWGLQALADCVL